jgi:hypothetical protein
MKKGLLLVIVLLCVAGLMAAMAYTSATVTNASTITVTNTNAALLALIPQLNTAVGNQDGTASIDANGKLFFNFAKGFGGATFGLQRSSTYEWHSLFSAKNNSEETIALKVKQDALVTGVTLSIRAAGTLTWTALTTTAQTVVTSVAPDAVPVALDVKIDVVDAALLSTTTPNIIVVAEAQ